MNEHLLVVGDPVADHLVPARGTGPSRLGRPGRRPARSRRPTHRDRRTIAVGVRPTGRRRRLPAVVGAARRTRVRRRGPHLHDQRVARRVGPRADVADGRDTEPRCAMTRSCAIRAGARPSGGRRRGGRAVAHRRCIARHLLGPRRWHPRPCPDAGVRPGARDRDRAGANVAPRRLLCRRDRTRCAGRARPDRRRAARTRRCRCRARPLSLDHLGRVLSVGVHPVIAADHADWAASALLDSFAEDLACCS